MFYGEYDDQDMDGMAVLMAEGGGQGFNSWRVALYSRYKRIWRWDVECIGFVGRLVLFFFFNPYPIDLNSDLSE